MNTADASKVTRQVQADLGETDERWFDPSGYNSVAMCVLDSVYSIGVRYSGVVNFLDAYRDLRQRHNADADTDTAGDLIGVFDALGGAEEFVRTLGYSWRTSSRSGVLKAQAALEAAQLLKNARLETVQTVRDQLSDPEKQKNSPVKAQWILITGQGSGLSWNYFLMLAGVQNVKADRMIVRYVTNALGRPVDPSEAAELVVSVAQDMGTKPIRLDHAIWRYESGREIYTDSVPTQ